MNPLSRLARWIFPPTLHPAATPPENQCPLVEAVDSYARKRICSFLPYADLLSLRLTCTTIRDDVLSSFLDRFEIPPYDNENKKPFCNRITTILHGLQNSPALNEEEQTFFSSLSANSLFANVGSVYPVLGAAYKSSLVALFLNEVSFPENASLKDKVARVRKHIRDRNKTIDVLLCENRQITYFPEELCDALPNLRTLVLTNNLIKSLPNSFWQFFALQTLNLSYNQISALPDISSQLTALQGLNLGNNLLKSLPESFGRLTALEQLLLQNNLLETLPVSLERLNALPGIYLKGNPLSSLPSSLQRFSDQPDDIDFLLP